MKKITKYEFEKGEMVVEVGKDYFKVLAQPEELLYKAVLAKMPNGIQIASYSEPEFINYTIYLRGYCDKYDDKKASFEPTDREKIVAALKEFGAEVVEPKEDSYVWFNVYKRGDELHPGFYLYKSKADAEEVGAVMCRIVGRMKVKLEEGRWDD